MAKRYQVIAPLIQAKSADGGTYSHLYQGASVSKDDLDPEQFEQLLESEMISASEDDLVEAQAVQGNDPNRAPGVPPENPEEGTTPSAEDEEPSRVDDIVASVGDDKDAARAALEKEQAQENPRPTLVKKLEAVIEA